MPLAVPAGAAASSFQQIFGDYRVDGQLNGCYPPNDLHNAGRQIPPDIEQYTPGFGDALAAAQTRCGAGAGAGATDEDAAAGAPISAGTAAAGLRGVAKKKAVREPPAPEASASPIPAGLADPRLAPATAVSSETPGALIALLVAAALAVALALAWTLAWFMGWSTERLTKPLFAAFQTVWDRLLPGR